MRTIRPSGGTTRECEVADGHRFGFELTFFRQGVSRAASSSPWFVHDLWMAHMALSDITGQRFYSEERLNRSGPGIAGVDAQTGLVWNGNWQAHIADQAKRNCAALPTSSLCAEA